MTEKRIRVRLDAGNTKAEIKSLNNEMTGLGSTSDKTTDSMRKLTSVAQAVATALATAQIIKYADSWTTVNNRLSQATSSASEFINAQKGVISIAQSSATDIEGVASAYSRLAQATDELDLSQEQLLNVTSKLTLALKAGGATADETSSVMIQLAQGLGSGALQGDELRSILEASIPISKALAAEFGVNVGQLKTLGSQGQITADRVISAIENMDDSALSFTKTFADGLTNVNNSLTVYVGEINESLGVTKTAGEALNSLANNIDTVGDGLIVVATIFGARMVGALASSTAALVAYTRQSLAASIQTNALGQVVARSTIAMNAQALAARGATAAMGLLGGPVGIAVVAASAIAYFATTMDTASTAADSYAERVKAVTGELKENEKQQGKANEALRDSLRINISSKIKALETDLKKQEQAILDATRSGADFSAGLTTATQKAGELESQINSLKQSLFELNSEASKEDILKGVNIGDQTGGQAPVTSGIDSNDAVNASLDTFFAEEDKLQFDALGNAIAYNQEKFENLKSSLAIETQAMQEEAEVRAAFAAGEINQRQLDEELALQNIFYNYEARRAAILENEQLTHDQKSELLAILSEQEIEAERIKQSELTAITQDGESDRTQIELLAQNARINNLQSGASSALSLLGAFGNQSFKTQKKFAIAESIVNIAGGVAKALNNPYPANLAFAAQVAAQGAGLIATIKSSQPSTSTSSVSTSGSAAATSSSSSTVASSASSTTTQNTQRVFNIELPDSGFVAVDTVGDILKSLAENSEDMQIAISKGQKQAQRVGAI
ncbi:tail length tape measure protein [Pseudoalteromonas phage BS5]|uniref:tail length tape measure protein n=1 Tax=Pseudoalteromonas phage BS5 TaxID=1874539 RepID=UPI0008199CE2|nr:tail length tape measure protein [Pseudoalteromonas phage BS5]ANY29587.1 tail length tape-measure protein [Pseudoalteromonas phage BS5]